MREPGKDKSNIRKFSFFPKTLLACMEPVTKPIFKSKGLANTRLLTEWPQIVGADLARRSMPQKLVFPTGKTVGGTLSIAVENGFAPEMQHLQPMILERLCTYFGYKAVTRIQISHAFLPAVKKEVAPKLNPEQLPAACAMIADEAHDPEMRAALKSLATTLSAK